VQISDLSLAGCGRVDHFDLSIRVRVFIPVFSFKEGETEDQASSSVPSTIQPHTDSGDGPDE